MTPLRSLAPILSLLVAFGVTALGLAAPGHAASLSRITTYAVHGRLVDVATGHAVRGARVSVRDVANLSHVLGSATSGRYGYFRVTGLPYADDGYAVRVEATGVGYGTGYVTSAHRLSSWGNAVPWGPGDLGTVRLRHH